MKYLKKYESEEDIISNIYKKMSEIQSLEKKLQSYIYDKLDYFYDKLSKKYKSDVIPIPIGYDIVTYSDYDDKLYFNVLGIGNGDVMVLNNDNYHIVQFQYGDFTKDQLTEILNVLIKYTDDDFLEGSLFNIDVFKEHYKNFDTIKIFDFTIIDDIRSDMEGFIESYEFQKYMIERYGVKYVEENCFGINDKIKKEYDHIFQAKKLGLL
jgi:hypothetical protein